MQCLNIPQEWFWYITVSWEPRWYDEVCVSCSNTVPRAQHKRFGHSTFMQALFHCATMHGLYVKYRKAIHDTHATCVIELHTEGWTTDRYGTAYYSVMSRVLYPNVSCLRELQFVWLSAQENNRLYLHCDALYRCEDVKRQCQCSVGRLGQG
jgi:hypothetical protein